MSKAKRSHTLSKQKVSECSVASELSNIAEDEDMQIGSKNNTHLEQFELEFSFRLKKFDQLLEEKLAALNRMKETMKAKCSTSHGIKTESADEIVLSHGKENISLTGMQSPSHWKHTQAENVASSSSEVNSMYLTPGKKQQKNKKALVAYSKANDFQTPMVSTLHTSLPTVTPKVAMNTPISMLRFPRQGEMALSLTGSPVMVTAMSHESKPNINIPLSDGKVMSLIPHEHLDPHNLPELDEETVQQLEALRENIFAFMNITK